MPNESLRLPAHPGEPIITVKIPGGISATARTSKTTKRRSVTLSGFGGTLVIRERERGSLQFRADWLPHVIVEARADRVATGTDDWEDAIQKGAKALELWYRYRVDRGDVKGDGPITLHRAIRILRIKNLIPGNTDKVKKGYRLVLDLAEAIFDEDTALPLHQGHVMRFIAARARVKDSAAKDEGPKFKWPASFPHRRPLKRVSPRTAEKNLLDLQTALRELLIAGGPNGEALLDEEPFVKAVNFGETEPEARHAYTLDRFAAVLTVSDDATELMRTEGLAVTENRSTGRRDTVKKLERIVPGILRMALHHQFSHPTRPASWQAVSISDVALDSDGVASLINSLRPRRHEPRFTVDAADIWVHGAIVYRRPFSKLKTERIVPLSPVFAAVVKEYLERRDRYLSALGVESDALYPSPRDPSRHMSDTDMRLLLKKGDEVARRRLAEAGGNPDRVIPLLAGTEWYGYRRLWKTEINGLGWEGESASLYVGDWKPSEKAIADRVYAGLKPRTLLAIVERISLPAAIARDADRPDRRDICNPEPVDFAKLAGR